MGESRKTIGLPRIISAVVIAVVAVVVVMRMSGRPVSGRPQSDDKIVAATEGAKRHPSSKATGTPVRLDAPTHAETKDTSSEESDAEVQTEDEKREAEEEKAVNAFDNLTDRWGDEAKKNVSMEDINAFAKAFNAVPRERQDECIHRALNLIPDDNVMLLVGILTDKSVSKEIVEEVFNDVLNRDEAVKQPILQQIFKDKTHPCWADAAWILDVTGELPGTK